MQYRKVVLVALGCAALGGCAPNHVMFVTDTSLGINVETKPSPTASVAFDRTEGYVGPSYANGALPPVVASLHVDGQSLLSPYVKQVYATGPAAVIVSGGTGQSPPTLTGDKRWAFVGTTTSVGFKIGFDTMTATPPPPIPDSFLFGYRRQELSILPVGSQTGVHSYPSVIASVNSTAGAGGGPAGSDFHHSQFIATGLAADALARNNGEIRAAFSAEAGATVKASLSPAAQDVVASLHTNTSNAISKISANLPDDANFATNRDALIAKATPALSGPAATYYGSLTSWSAFLGALSNDTANAAAIAASLP